MKRFEAVTVDKDDFGGWIEVRDTRRGYTVLISQDHATASLVADELNALRPQWFATTFEGNVFFDVRCGPYAAARMRTVREVAETGATWAVGQIVASMEIDLHRTIARYVAKV